MPNWLSGFLQKPSAPVTPAATPSPPVESKKHYFYGKRQIGSRSTAISPILTEAEQFQVMVWLAEFHHPASIPNLIFTTFGKTVERTYAYRLRKTHKWSAMIDRKRQQWALEVGEEALAHKRFRLQKLQEQLDSTEKNPKLSDSTRGWRILQILNQARLEMEESKTAFTFNYFNALNTLDDQELLVRRDALLKRIQTYRLPIRRRLNGLGNGSAILEATTGEPETGDGGDQEVGNEPDDGTVESPPAQG